MTRIVWKFLLLSTFPMMIEISGKSTSFASKMLVRLKTTNRKSSKFSKVKFWPKSRIQNSANIKPFNLELLTLLTCLIFLSWLEKCFEVIGNFQKFKCEGDWAKLRQKNCLLRQSWTKYLASRKEIQLNWARPQKYNI